MIEWLSNNWQELLGSGGIGVIIVALITIRSKKNSKPTVSQKIKTGNNSTTYQSGGDMAIGADKVGDKNV